MTDWQPIETAPTHKEATVLLWNGRDVFVGVYEFCDLRGWRVYMDGENANNATHWMPLPDPPAA